MRVQMQLAYIDNGHLKNHHTGSKLTSKSKAYCLWRNLPRHCTFSKKKYKNLPSLFTILISRYLKSILKGKLSYKKLSFKNNTVGSEYYSALQ